MIQLIIGLAFVGLAVIIMGVGVVIHAYKTTEHQAHLDDPTYHGPNPNPGYRPDKPTPSPLPDEDIEHKT